MTPYHQLQTRLQATPSTWLITGVAGFIGSSLLETLPKLDQRIVGLEYLFQPDESDLRLRPWPLPIHRHQYSER